jgi:hypothetical protein
MFARKETAIGTPIVILASDQEGPHCSARNLSGSVAGRDMGVTICSQR